MKLTKLIQNLIGPALLLYLTVLVCVVAAKQPQGVPSSGPKGEWHDTQWGKWFQPKAGVVPDEKTAIRIAEAVLLPIYGERTIGSERPLKALRDGVWMVEGTLPKGVDGGTAVVRLSRDDGRVLFIAHYQ